MLQVIYNKRLDFTYIQLNDVKKIIDEDDKKEYMLVSKKEYEHLKKLENDFKRSPSLF